MKSRPDTAVLALMLLTLSSPSHAYLDPNIGSMLLQGLLAGFAAAGVAIRMYWHRITAFFRGTDSEQKDQPDEETAGDAGEDDADRP